MTPYINLIFVFPGIPGEVRLSKTFPYPEDKTPSQLADEIAEWIRGLNDRRTPVHPSDLLEVRRTHDHAHMESVVLRMDMLRRV